MSERTWTVLHLLLQAERPMLTREIIKALKIPEGQASSVSNSLTNLLNRGILAKYERKEGRVHMAGWVVRTARSGRSPSLSPRMRQALMVLLDDGGDLSTLEIASASGLTAHRVTPALWALERAQLISLHHLREPQPDGSRITTPYWRLRVR